LGGFFRHRYLSVGGKMLGRGSKAAKAEKELLLESGNAAAICDSSTLRTRNPAHSQSTLKRTSAPVWM